jgi:hypothetical protein
MIEVLDNQPPVCEPVTAETLEDMPANITLAASDPDGDALTFTATQGANGSVSVSGNVATYVPNPNYFGADVFSFTATDPSGASSTCDVTVSVLPVNDAPVCSDAVASTEEDVPVNITLQASDVDSAELTYSIVSGPANGMVSLSGNVATYTGNLNYSGTDSFTFKASDGQAESGVCTVSITITPVNDAPVAVIEVSPLADLGDTVPGINIISGNGVNACVGLDGSQSSDADNAVGDLTYLWMIDGDVAGAEISAEVCLTVGSHQVTLIVSDGSASGETTETVDVLSAAEAVEELIMVVNDSIVARSNKQPSCLW